MFHTKTDRPRLLRAVLVALLVGLPASLPLLAKRGSPPIRVAVFKGLGADPECLSDAVEALKIDPSMEPVVMTAAEIVQGQLDRCDAIVFPGGGGKRQMASLGGRGRAKVLSFVKERGKGAVGLCAGAYMLSDTPEYSCFHLAPLEAIDREHDERGHGMVRVSFTPDTPMVFPELKGRASAFMQYFEGPVLIPSKGGAFTSVAVMESDVALQNDAPPGMTNGKTFLAWADAGKGRVFISSGHPENTPGLRWMVPRMVRWTLRERLVSYGSKVVRVDRNDREVLFDRPMRKAEAALFEDLAFGSVEQKLAAVPALLAMRSWGAKERLEGSLRDDDPRVRAAAAEALVDLEHTAAVSDLKIAVATEPDPGTKRRLSANLGALLAMTGGR